MTVYGNTQHCWLKYRLIWEAYDKQTDTDLLSAVQKIETISFGGSRIKFAPLEVKGFSRVSVITCSNSICTSPDAKASWRGPDYTYNSYMNYYKDHDSEADNLGLVSLLDFQDNMTAWIGLKSWRELSDKISSQPAIGSVIALDYILTFENGSFDIGEQDDPEGVWDGGYLIRECEKVSCEFPK